MSKSGVLVQLQPRTLPCHGVTAWHADSALLVCSFEYGPDPKRAPATVAERIDAALGISTTPPRALLGDVDVIWQDESRLHSIELRTGRHQWEPSSLGAPTARLEDNVFVCIDREQALSEIRFEDVRMESGEPPN